MGNLGKKIIKTLTGNVYGSGMAAGNSMIGGYINEYFADRAREKNFQTNERAADAADKRQRKQYEDLYSPEAMMKQYAAAGLSPSMMMAGGQSAVGGTAQGNIGGGASGGYPGAPYTDPLTFAQIQNINADTKGKEFENIVKEIEAQLRQKSSLLDSAELDLIGMRLYNETTKQTESLMSAASRFNTYEEFVKYLKKDVNIEGIPNLQHYIESEAAQKTLKQIFLSSKEINKDVTQILGDKEYANLMLEMYKKLDSEDYANLSAKQLIAELRKITEADNLEADKKKTINDIFNKIENENVRAILMILYMLGDRYLGSISGNAHFGRNVNTSSNSNTNNSYSVNYNHNISE